MPEIVYAFTNAAMPGLIKIGQTKREEIKNRLNDLYYGASGVPVPFECLYAVEVEDAQKVEDALHEAFDVDRPNRQREFFTTNPDRIIALLKGFAKSDQSAWVQSEIDATSTPEDKQALDNVVKENTKRRRGFTFSALGISEGEELVYAHDETKTCKVVDDKRVHYDGRD